VKWKTEGISKVIEHTACKSIVFAKCCTKNWCLWLSPLSFFCKNPSIL